MSGTGGLGTRQIVNKLQDRNILFVFITHHLDTHLAGSCIEQSLTFMFSSQLRRTNTALCYECYMSRIW